MVIARPPIELSIEELIARARALASSASRSLLGITGAPGAGKSTIAQILVAALGGSAQLVPMDGFHLANEQLRSAGTIDRKGAVETFDAWGFTVLVDRLTKPGAEPIYAPRFDRVLDEPIAGAIAVYAHTRLVVVEGTYLLLNRSPWCLCRSLFSDVWYCELPKRERLSRLIARHEGFGRSHQEAEAWARGTDERNATVIAATRGRADLVFTLR